MNTPDPTYGKDLTPKKIIFHGHIQFGEYISFSVNSFQELATAHAAKGMFDLVINFFGIHQQVVDVDAAFQTFLANPKLLVVKSMVNDPNGEIMPPVTIESNGGRYPSCSMSFSTKNPLWDKSTDMWTDSWSIGYEYRKGKWTINHTDKQGGYGSVPHKVYPKTRQQMLDLVELVRGTKDEV